MAKHKTKKVQEGLVVGSNPQASGGPLPVKKISYIAAAVAGVLIVGTLIFVLVKGPGNKTPPLTYGNMYQQVRIYNKNNQTDKSIALIQQYLNQKPTPDATSKSSAEAVLSIIYTNSKNKTAALTWMQKSLDDNPKPIVQDYLNLATAYANDGQKDKAITAYKKALEINNKTQSLDQAAQYRYIQGIIDDMQGQKQ